MDRPPNLRAAPATGPSMRQPLSLLATPAPISIFAPLCFQSLAHSFAITRGGGYPAFTRRRAKASRAKRGTCLSCTSYHSISFRIRTSKPTPRFFGFWPKLSACNPFRMRSSTNRVCNSFRMRTCERTRGRGFRRMRLLRPVGAQPVPLHPPLRSATMTSNRETSPLGPVSNLKSGHRGRLAAEAATDCKSCL